ncbi:aspartate/glutamate racemase family protein [Acidimangrovimonas sediminis]|uniref:aspartate/glutamate racemase family protein n=1 Tax=Acidimangrovimonas sediminis TaxID=2056283 RepID=UPI000C80584D|nr:aspartate/glutamate racemase family protein [Acidimangrovimonas sediminis]
MTRLLIVNPNTTVALTDRLVAGARAALPAGVEVVGRTAGFGAPVIASRLSYAVGALAGVVAMAESPGRFSAVLLGCFGDPGLEALRELSAAPVVGMAEAAMRAAARRSGRFAILTLGAAWRPMLEERAAVAGLGGRLAGVFTLDGTGLDALADPEGTRRRLERAVEGAVAAGAETIVLGGATLAGLPCPARPGVVFVDGFAAALDEVRQLLAMGLPGA